MTKLKVSVILLTVVACSVIGGVKPPEKRGRKDTEPIIDPELEKLIPSSDADVAGSPLSVPLKIEIVDGTGVVEESPLHSSHEKSGKSKEPLYKAIVIDPIEDTPGGWGLGWDDEGDNEPLTYHGWGGEKPVLGWKPGDDVQHGWKHHNMEHHHGWHHQKHGHDHKHGHKHGHDHKHGHKHGHKHDHKHGHKHGHDHKHGHKHGHHHKHGHEHKHGHKHDHGHKHHHKHEHHHHHHHHHGHKHGHDHKGWHEGGDEGSEGGGDEGGDERR